MASVTLGKVGSGLLSISFLPSVVGYLGSLSSLLDL